MDSDILLRLISQHGIGIVGLVYVAWAYSTERVYARPYVERLHKRIEALEEDNHAADADRRTQLQTQAQLIAALMAERNKGGAS